VRKVVPGPCPSCNTEIEYLYQTENIPYFSDILIISAACAACGYRYVDTQLLKDADPVRYEMPVTTISDLDVRVVRSMSGAIEIPELGVRRVCYKRGRGACPDRADRKGNIVLGGRG